MKEIYKSRITGEETKFPQADKVITKAERKHMKQKEKYPAIYASRWPNEGK